MINDLERTTLLEEVSWRQKSRLWLREGDKCTKFFHRVANSNRRNNFIEQLVVNGTVSLQISLRSENTLCSSTIACLLNGSVGRPRLDGLTFDSIGEDEAIWLERAFEEDEVFEVVKALIVTRPRP
jgi:hypothetical protein